SIGALTVVSGRTIGVPKLTRDRLDDLRNVRLEVEIIAARWATLRCDDAFIAQLAQCLSRLAAATEAVDIEAYVKANYDFHFTIYRHANSPTLLAIIENLWLQVSPYLHLLKETGSFRFAGEQHDLIYEGMQKGDPERVCRALFSDLDEAYKIIAKMIGSNNNTAYDRGRRYEQSVSI
ncbi:MAG: GntR family transcriptional regulator, partial [Xanthobacteraceae bacterium]